MLVNYVSHTAIFQGMNMVQFTRGLNSFTHYIKQIVFNSVGTVHNLDIPHLKMFRLKQNSLLPV